MPQATPNKTRLRHITISHTPHQVSESSESIPNNKNKETKADKQLCLGLFMFYLYVFALTLDLPSASIKCSTYVTSPTTNQIPETTHTKGEKPREQWGFRAETQVGRPVTVSSDCQSRAIPQHLSSTKWYRSTKGKLGSCK